MKHICTIILITNGVEIGGGGGASQSVSLRKNSAALPVPITVIVFLDQIWLRGRRPGVDAAKAACWSTRDREARLQ